MTWWSRKHADQAAPQHGGDRRAEPAADDPAERERDREAGDDPEPEQLVDDAHDPVPQQVWREPLALGGTDGLEQPADVGVPQALDAAPEAGAAQVRGVGVALLVGERVMLAVVGDPGDHGSLHGHRAEHGDDRPERA